MHTSDDRPLGEDDFRITDLSSTGPRTTRFRPRRRTNARRRLARLVDAPGVTPEALASVQLVRYGEPGPDATVVLLAGGFGVRTWEGVNALERALADADFAVGIGVMPASLRLVESAAEEDVAAAA